MITGKTYFEMSQQEHMPNQTQILKTENMTKIKRDRMQKEVKGCRSTYANSMYPLLALVADNTAA